MNGVPLMVVAKNLGHADTRMVEKHYGHLAPSFIIDAIHRRRAPLYRRAQVRRRAAAEGAKVIRPMRGQAADVGKRGGQRRSHCARASTRFTRNGHQQRRSPTSPDLAQGD
jgi:hypothetical protein